MLSVVDLNVGLFAVEAARSLAGEVWTRCRALSRVRMRGLNSQKAVRRRLHEIAGSTGEGDWMEAPLDELLERSEELLLMVCPGEWPSPDRMLQHAKDDARVALDLVVVQSMAARMGHWRGTHLERADGETARRFVEGHPSVRFEDYRMLLSDARMLAKDGCHAEAVRSRFAADRLVRTASNLVDAASSLCRIGDRTGALWCLRMALLEPRASFGDEHALIFAEKLYERLAGDEELVVQTRDIEIVALAPRRFEAVLVTAEEAAADAAEDLAGDVMAALQVPATGRIQVVTAEAPGNDDEAMSDAFSTRRALRPGRRISTRDPDLVDTLDATWLVRPRRI